MARVHTTGHHEIASTLGRRTNQDGCLHLDEVQVVQEVTNQNRHPVAQFQVLANAATAQVQITILHTDIVSTISIVLNGEGRRHTLAEHVQLLSQDLDVARLHLRVLSLALAHGTRHLDAPLTTQLVSLFTKGSILRLVEHQLRNAIAITQVDKRHTTHLSRFLYPASQCYLAACIGETQLTTSFTPVHLVIFTI